MIPFVTMAKKANVGVPRVGGGDPGESDELGLINGCSPRRRG